MSGTIGTRIEMIMMRLVDFMHKIVEDDNNNCGIV